MSKTEEKMIQARSFLEDLAASGCGHHPIENSKLSIETGTAKISAEASAHRDAVKDYMNQVEELRDAVLQIARDWDKRNIGEAARRCSRAANINRCMKCGQWRFDEDLKAAPVGMVCKDDCAIDPELP